MHNFSEITPELKQKLSHDLYFVRGFAILWVVVGHVIGHRSAGIRQLYDQDIPILAGIYTFIYSFHMPIFFIVSGISFAVFSKSNTSYIKFAKSRLFRLIIPLIYWSPIYFILRASNGKTEFSILGIFNAIFSGDFIFWFFPALAFASALSFGSIKQFGSRKIYLIISIILFLVSFKITGYISSWCYFNIFYTLGFMIAPYLSKTGLNIRKLSVVVTSVFIILLIFAMLAFNHAIGTQPLGKCINGILGFCLAYILATYDWFEFSFKLLAQPFACLGKTFVYFGKISMSIYVLHIIFGSFIRTVLVKVGIIDIASQFAIGLFMSLLGPVLTHLFLHKRSQLFLYSIGEIRS